MTTSCVELFRTRNENECFCRLEAGNAGNHHLRPGRTRHRIDGKDFPPFVSLEIAQYPADGGFYLLHICGNGAVADTYHESMEEAMHQAEFEFGVQATEWVSATS